LVITNPLSSVSANVGDADIMRTASAADEINRNVIETTPLNRQTESDCPELFCQYRNKGRFAFPTCEVNHTARLRQQNRSRYGTLARAQTWPPVIP
jgi:hypothetical protein